MSKMVVYNDGNYPTSWISKKWGSDITTMLSDKSFIVKNALELKEWMKECLAHNESHESVVVFSQDMIPNTILGNHTPNNLIRKYLDEGGRVIWLGDIPFWTKGTQNGSRHEIWGHGAHFAMLGVQPFIAESSSSCKWVGRWSGLMKSSWYSQRPINIEYIEELRSLTQLGLTIWPMAYAEITLLPTTWNAMIITRWKKAGSKVGSFGLSLLGTGGNVTLTEEYPEEFSLKPLNLISAWHIIFNRDHHQGFYRFWDTGTTDDEPPENLLEDLYTLATLEIS